MGRYAVCVLALVVTVMLLASFIPLNPITPKAAAAAGFTDSRFVGGLNNPTSMEFSPDGRLFVAEQDGNLRIIKNGELLSASFLKVTVSSSGERGLLGIAFDPGFATNGYVYVYYTATSPTIHNRVSRFTADPSNPDIALAGSERSILDLETLSSATNHNGGAIHFGKDGKLYVAVGDNANSSNSQSLSTRLGKILRVNSDGSIPADNPFYNTSGARREIWALGLRNPFTFSFSSASGVMHVNDVGQSSWEEVNVGKAGANYGWPSCEGACSNPSFVNPVYAYAHSGDGAAISGSAFYEGAQFPIEYKGSYFFGDYVAGFIRRLTPANQAVDFLSNTPGIVDIKIGSDGSLYYLTRASDEVHKVVYSSGTNANPAAVATANPTFGPAPLRVTFDGTKSSDPDAGDVLAYSWNFGDSSLPATGSTAVHTYNTAGPFVATLTVTDGRGGSNSATANINVGTVPVGTIDTPAAGKRYNAGDTISFSGSGTDKEDGVLPASAFHWEILFHHNTHTHPVLKVDGVKSGSFIIPKVGETSSDVWYRIYLTVNDSTGLTSAAATRDVLPNKVTVTLASNPSGLQVNLDGQLQTTPYSFVGVVGITRTLQAPDTQSLNGQTYRFQSWSDGGAVTHTIDTPSSSATYSATYAIVGDTIRPTVSIASPSGGSTIFGPSSGVTANISGTASDSGGSGLKSVAVRIDGSGVYQPATLTPQGSSFTWTHTRTLATGGSHTITARATDNQGNLSWSTITVNTALDNTSPAIAISSPVDRQRITGPTTGAAIKFDGTASDGQSGVMNAWIRMDSGAYTAVTPKAPGDFSTWTQTITVTASGNHNFEARVTDKAGNSSWHTISLNVRLK